MSRSRHPSRSLARRTAASWSLALGLVACGGKTPPPPPPAPAPPSATTSATPTAPPAPPSNPPSTKATVKNDAAWAACHAHYEAKKKDVSKDVQAMAAACAKVTKMKLVGATLTGKQGDQAPPK